MVHPLCDRHFRSAYSLRCRRAGLWSLSGRIIGPKCIRGGTVVPLRPQNRRKTSPRRDCSPSPDAKSARTATRAGLWDLAGGIAASKRHRGGTAADAFAAKKPCASFLAQTRPEKGPFGAKTLPRLQQEWPVRPISRKCVRRTDRACVLVDKRQRREVVRSKMGRGRWSMVSYEPRLYRRSGFNRGFFVQTWPK